MKETFWAFASKGVAFLSHYVLLFFLTASMTIENWGKWSLIYSYVSLFMILSIFGMSFTVRHFFAKYYGTDEWKEIVKNVLTVRLAISSGLVIILLIGYFFVKTVFEAHDLISVWFWIMPIVFLYGIVDILKAGFESLQKLKFTFFATFSEHGLNLLLVTILFTIGGTFESILSGYSISYFITVVLGLFLLKKYFLPGGSILKPLRKTSTHTINIIRYNIPALLMAFGAVLLVEVDTIMLSSMKGDIETGIYSTAKQLVKYLPHISLAISMGTIPAFAKLTEHNRAKIKKQFLNVFGINLGVFLLLGIGILILSPILIPLFFDEKYLSSVLVAQLLIPYLIFYGGISITNSLLNYWGKLKLVAYIQSVTILINFALNYWLIPNYGANGAAVATSLSMLPSYLISLFLVFKVLNSKTHT